MKKRLFNFAFVGLIAFLLILNLIVIVSAEGESDMPSSGIGEGDYDTINNLTGIIPLDPSTGGIDPTKFNQTQSKAEQKIVAIDLWIENNASWLKFFFGMIPEISWIFAINLWLILILIVNFRNIFVNFSSFSEKVATIIAIALSFMAVLFQATVKAAIAIDKIISTWVFKAILVALIIVSIMISFGIGKWAKKRKLAKAEMKLQLNAQKSETLGKLSDEINENLND